MEKYYFLEKYGELSLSRDEDPIGKVLELAKGKVHYDSPWALLAENDVKFVDHIWFYKDGELFVVKLEGYYMYPAEQCFTTFPNGEVRFMR